MLETAFARQNLSELSSALAYPQPSSSLLHLTSLVLAHAVVVACLGVDAAGDFRAYTVLDGDGLQGGGLREGQRLSILGALSGWRGAVGGVVDASAVGTGDGYLSALSELSITAELRSGYR